MKRSYTISVPVGVFWFVLLPAAVLTAAMGALLGMVAIDRLIMPNLPGISDRGVLATPAIVGMDYEQGRQRLYDVGLRAVVEDRQYSTSAPDGVILSQRPEGGAEVKKGRQVNVVVSKGPEADTLPEVRGVSERQARKKLREAGFGNVSMGRAYHEQTPKDLVAATEPPAGTVISREIEVQLTISRGPRPTHAEVPNLIGEMLSDANLKIEENGLTVGRVEYRHTSTARPGSVISQSFAPGTSVPLESGIDIVVAGSR